MLEGPSDTPYEGGWYWGRLKFPRDYPFAPPSILMVTPNGRFETNTRLCLSMSDYHPENWQPSWSLATVLKGLLSFMCEESPTAGAVDPPPSNEERRRLARSSLAWNKVQADFFKAFPEVENITAEVEARKQHKVEDDRPAGAEGTVEVAASDACASRAFVVGDVVRLHSLKARTDLNDIEGFVEAAADETAPSRVRVRVKEESVCVKAENLAWLRGAADGRAA